MAGMAVGGTESRNVDTVARGGVPGGAVTVWAGAAPIEASGGGVGDDSAGLPAAGAVCVGARLGAPTAFSVVGRWIGCDVMTASGGLGVRLPAATTGCGDAGPDPAWAASLVPLTMLCAFDRVCVGAPPVGGSVCAAEVVCGTCKPASVVGAGGCAIEPVSGTTAGPVPATMIGGAAGPVCGMVSWLLLASADGGRAVIGGEALSLLAVANQGDAGATVAVWKAAVRSPMPVETCSTALSCTAGGLAVWRLGPAGTRSGATPAAAGGSAGSLFVPAKAARDVTPDDAGGVTVCRLSASGAGWREALGAAGAGALFIAEAGWEAETDDAGSGVVWRVAQSPRGPVTAADAAEGPAFALLVPPESGWATMPGDAGGFVVWRMVQSEAN
jgi:hypothetical protein